MSTGYDDMIRYADASLAAHRQRVADLQERNPAGSWGGQAMCHRLRLEDWRRHNSPVFINGPSRAPRARCARAGSSSARTRCAADAGTSSSVGSATSMPRPTASPRGTSYREDHTTNVLWCAFCGPINPVRRTATGALDRDDVEDMLERHSHLCPAP